MREKLKIANQMRVSRKSFRHNAESLKLYSKCYRAYVIECIFKGKENFKVSFGSNYIQSFSERVSDWYNYILGNVRRFFIIHFTNNGDRTLIAQLGVSKPIHLKIAQTPNEWILYEFLERNGFRVANEHLSLSSIVYEIVRA